MGGAGLLIVLGFGLLGSLPEQPNSAERPEWPGWGGPRGNFSVQSAPLADRWPADGPPILWKRGLGRGCSTILVRDSVLYTVFRDGEEEVTTALEAESGRPRWELRTAVPDATLDRTKFVKGPNATGVLGGGFLFTAGVTGRIACVDVETGTLRWSRDLYQEFGATRPGHGYSSSPVLFKNAVIACVGGAGKGLVAFDQKDGSILWKGHSAQNSYGSPLLVRVGDGEQLVVPMGARHLFGVEPGSGKLLWKREHEHGRDRYIGSPISDGEGRVFVSSGGMARAVLLELRATDGKTEVIERWTSGKARVGFTNPVWVGDTIYATSSGGTGSVHFLRAVDATSGAIRWSQRTLPVHLLAADGKLLALDVDGGLSLGTPTATGYEPSAHHPVLESRCWSTPTLVGSRLYLRDEKSILALDLGVKKSSKGTSPRSR